MRMVSFIRAAFLIVALIGFVPVVHAAPITYVQTGIASGILGATSFVDAFVTVTLTGDTDNVVAEQFGEFNCSFCFVNEGTVTVHIPSVGTATVTDASGIWMFAQPVDIDDDPTTPDLPAAVIGTLDGDPPTTDSFTGIGGTGNMALLDYDLTTSIGPVSSALLGGVGYPPQLFLNTDLGVLRFRENLASDSDGTFTATVGVAEVPEPATLFLFGSGVAAFAARGRRRARR
jgi:PEP-CTERM motif-containing protein